MTSRTSGSSGSSGAGPAEIALTREGAQKLLKNAAAICERPTFWAQAKSTFFMASCQAERSRRDPRERSGNTTFLESLQVSEIPRFGAQLQIDIRAFPENRGASTSVQPLPSA